MRHPALFFELRPIIFFLILLIISITTCRDTSSNSLAKEQTADAVNQRHSIVGKRLQPSFVEGNGLDSSRRDSRYSVRRLVALDPVHPAHLDS